MALTDPQSITVNSVAQSMPRLSSTGLTSSYLKSDQTFGLDIKHTPFLRDKKKRVRSLVAFKQRAVVPDPLTAVNDFEDVVISFQIDRPEHGFTSTQIDHMRAGFFTWLNTALLDKLFGRES